MRRGALPRPGGRKELCDYVQRIHSRPLDRSKSLWELYVIEGLEDGHVAVLTKVHHAMIDGVSGMDIATVLFDLGPSRASSSSSRSGPSRRRAPGSSCSTRFGSR
jgi:diacylglycerol O-acyltransferase